MHITDINRCKGNHSLALHSYGHGKSVSLSSQLLNSHHSSEFHQPSLRIRTYKDGIKTKGKKTHLSPSRLYFVYKENPFLETNVYI